MADTKEPKSTPGCKVVLFRRAGRDVRFGLRDEEGRQGFPALAFPDLMEIDSALLAFGRETLGLVQPKVHGRFVERPSPTGWLFYLLEECAPPGPGEGDCVHWGELGRVMPELDPEERKALVRAIRYLTEC